MSYSRRKGYGLMGDRRWNELRRISAQLSTQSAVDGSSYLEQGNTKIICTVIGPIEKGSSGGPGGSGGGGGGGGGAGGGANGGEADASVLFEVNYAAFSGMERKKRGRGDKRVAEMQSALQRTFASIILTHLYPRSEILITLHILSQDGSVLASCINATTLALIDAGIPLQDYVTACTAASSSTGGGGEDGLGGADPLLDMNSIEEGDLPGVTVATVGGGERIVLCSLESRVQLARLEGMIAVAVGGCAELRGVLDGVVRKWGREVLRRRDEAGWVGGGGKKEE
ncbi:3' exoribonuclease family, domain 1-domain-containing protein [Peziza echinospora]|nr:3' exoribonuclease family, domain 1-domain-containing protein [Peziza echinospora]